MSSIRRTYYRGYLISIKKKGFMFLGLPVNWVDHETSLS